MSKLRDSFLKANNFFKDGNFEEAQDLYKEIIKVNPYLIKAWNNLAVSYIKLGNFVKAIEIITKALKIEPDNESLWRNLGIVYFQAGEYEEAIKNFKKSLVSCPKNETIWHNIGVAHTQLGNHEEAIKAYKYALDLNDRYLSAWKNICLIYSSMGVDFKYDDLRPNTEIAWYFLSKALLIHGLFEDALDACNKALRKNPGFHAAYIFKNKVKSMIKEKKAVNFAKTRVLTQQQATVLVKEDNYYQRFKKVQGKMQQFEIKSTKQKDLSLEEKFRLLQKKHRKRKMELEGIIELEEDTIKPKQTAVSAKGQKQKMITSSPTQVNIQKKIEEILPVKQVTKSTAKSRLIFIGNNYRKMEDCFFVVDGANVAREGLNSSRSGKIFNLELLKKKLNSFSISNYLIICDRSLNYTIDDQETYSKMVQNEEILETPGGTEADYYILQVAKERDAYMISNDMFKEFYNYFGKQWIKSRRITFKIFRQSLFFDKIFTVS